MLGVPVVFGLLETLSRFAGDYKAIGEAPGDAPKTRRRTSRAEKPKK